MLLYFTHKLISCLLFLLLDQWSDHNGNVGFVTIETHWHRVGINALQHCNSLFNCTMSYKLDSDIRYVYAKIIVDTKFQDGYDLKKNCLEVKQKNAIILVSNCHRDHLNLLQSVKKHIDVNIYGNYGKRCIPPHAIKCFSYIPMYEFYLAFENSICQGYLTRSNNHKSSNERSN